MVTDNQKEEKKQPP